MIRFADVARLAEQCISAASITETKIKVLLKNNKKKVFTVEDIASGLGISDTPSILKQIRTLCESLTDQGFFYQS